MSILSKIKEHFFGFLQSIEDAQMRRAEAAIKYYKNKWME